MALKSSMSDEPDKKKMGWLVMLFQVVLLWVGPQLSGRLIHFDCNLGTERSGAALEPSAAHGSGVGPLWNVLATTDGHVPLK